MSRKPKSILAAAVAAIAVGSILTATPAHAVAEVAPAGQPSSITGVADWEKSPNVTVTVIGKLPEISAQADVYSQNPAIPSRVGGASTLAASTVPFDFKLYGVWDMPGRDFTSARSVVCKDIAITYTGGGPGSPPASDFRVSLSGGSVRVPIDGVARSYCWSGVPTGQTLNFYYRMVDQPVGSGSYSKVDGSGRVRYADQ
jgi:hypothetical protein